MTCIHDLAEMDTAAHADGLCPLCLKAEIDRLRAAMNVIINDASTLPLTQEFARSALHGPW